MIVFSRVLSSSIGFLLIVLNLSRALSNSFILLWYSSWLRMTYIDDLSARRILMSWLFLSSFAAVRRAGVRSELRWWPLVTVDSQTSSALRFGDVVTSFLD